MQFKIESTDFINIVKNAALVITGRNLIQALCCVYIEIKPEFNMMTVVACQDETWFKTEYGIDIVKKSDNKIVLIDALKLKKISNEIGKGKELLITFTDKLEMVIEFDKTKLLLKGYDPNTYIDFTDAFNVEKPIARLSASEISSLFEVKFGVSKETYASNYMFGLKLEFEKDKITALGINGALMALSRIKHDNEIDKDVGIILPIEIVDLISRIGEEFELSIIKSKSDDSSKIIFANLKTLIVSPLINGVYVSWKFVYNQDTEGEVLINKNSFSDALRKANLFSSDYNDVIIIKLNNNQLTVVSGNVEEGGGNTDLIIESGLVKTFAVQYKHIADMGSFMTKEVIMRINNTSDAGKEADYKPKFIILDSPEPDADLFRAMLIGCTHHAGIEEKQDDPPPQIKTPALTRRQPRK
jgi:DNA polymerase III sliding clamp (beta) subunit (PCNA family)